MIRCGGRGQPSAAELISTRWFLISLSGDFSTDFFYCNYSPNIIITVSLKYSNMLAWLFVIRFTEWTNIHILRFCNRFSVVGLAKHTSTRHDFLVCIKYSIIFVQSFRKLTQLETPNEKIELCFILCEPSRCRFRQSLVSVVGYVPKSHFSWIN